MTIWPVNAGTDGGSNFQREVRLTVATLEDLQAGAFIKGLAPGGAAKVVQIEWFGDQAVKVTYEDATGAVHSCSGCWRPEN